MRSEIVFFVIIFLLAVFIVGHKDDNIDNRKTVMHKKDSVHRVDSATIEHLKYALKIQGDIINKLKWHK